MNLVKLSKLVNLVILDLDFEVHLDLTSGLVCSIHCLFLITLAHVPLSFPQPSTFCGRSGMEVGVQRQGVTRRQWRHEVVVT